MSKLKDMSAAVAWLVVVVLIIGVSVGAWRIGKRINWKLGGYEGFVEAEIEERVAPLEARIELLEGRDSMGGDL